MPVLIDEDEVLNGFADVSLSEDDLAIDPAQLINLTNNEDGYLEAGPRGIEGSSTNISEPASVHRGGAQVEIRPSLSNYPKSLYEGCDTLIPSTPERIALENVLQEYHSQKDAASSMAMDDGCIMLSLYDFRIYRPAGPKGSKIKTSRQFEMEPLHHLKKGTGCDELLFDGTISVDNVQHYVQGVRFQTMAIEGYGDPSIHSVRDHISIQSPLAFAKHVWYLLKEPSSEYLPYHKPFLWVADFAKHAVDYMAKHENVSLHHFKSKFHEWFHQQHSQNEICQEWFSHFGRHDFRQAFNAYAGFLWKESWSVVKHPHNDPIWAEINYISDEKGLKMTGGSRTVITPFVFKNFKHISQLTEFFEVYKPNNRRMVNAWKQRKTLMGFVEAQNAQCLAMDDTVLEKGKIQKGDFVVVRPDAETIWKDGSNLWYAYIQEIHKDRHGELFNVIWLYAPSATTLAGGAYPFANELFFSGHCNCDEGRLRIHDIIGKIDVKWLKPRTMPEELASEQFHFFMRQKYDTKNHCFVTLKDSDFLCACNKQLSIFDELVTRICIGDPVLVPFTTDGKPSKRPLDDYDSSDKISDTLEPVVVTNFLYETQKVNVRRLIRRRRDSQSRQNELVWTEEFLEISPEIVGEKCHIRFFQEKDINTGNIPPPYNRNGSGNCWYITTRRKQEGEFEKLDLPYPTGLNEGLDPVTPSPRPKMVGLDTFCGGGNFGRGLAEGMAVEFVYAIDWVKNAVSTYKANHSGQKPCWVYWGSVNDYLKEVMNGSKMECFAKIGGIDFIAAGSPCQGFSGLQRDKASESSLRNISMVASVAAFVDFYRPKYALLENVVAMAHRGKEQLGIFPQLLCTLVGMGYQQSMVKDTQEWAYIDDHHCLRRFMWHQR
ncbi:hypothetical protein SLS56_011574 [Neofusicoccum ribis]|uniref:DNA (cytosine-5-)-methyltransferase n=1 Tax=Neofusicoccum ribis TaxID=45134 RepID=A0ABR3SBW0_9PEZI